VNTNEICVPGSTTAMKVAAVPVSNNKLVSALSIRAVLVIFYSEVIRAPQFSDENVVY